MWYDMNNMNDLENLTKRGDPEELDDLEMFYDTSLDSEKHQAILTSNRRRKEMIEKRLIKKKHRTITGRKGNRLFIGSFVEENAMALIGDIREELTRVGYSEDQVMEISNIFRRQRKVLRLKVSTVAAGNEEVVMVDEEVSLKNESSQVESTIDSSSV